MMNTIKCPKISIVTPSLNQGKFIETTIKSILEQGYPNLEYVIIDGKSTDDSVDIIHKYENNLSYWVSEKDNGQYDAINKGFSKTTGEIMAWLNADDIYTPWAFSIVAEIFETFPEVEWLTTSHSLIWDSFSRAVKSHSCGGFNRQAFFKGVNLPGGNWYSRGWIQQESTFWRKSLWDRAGGIDSTLKLAGDFELWAKFFRQAELYSVSTPLGGFRMHADQKTAHNISAYLEEAEAILYRYGEQPYGKLESALRSFFGLCTGYRAIPRDFLSPLFANIMSRTPFFYPARFCTWTKNGWKVVDSFIY